MVGWLGKPPYTSKPPKSHHLLETPTKWAEPLGQRYLPARGLAISPVPGWKWRLHHCEENIWKDQPKPGTWDSHDFWWGHLRIMLITEFTEHSRFWNHKTMVSPSRKTGKTIQQGHSCWLLYRCLRMHWDHGPTCIYIYMYCICICIYCMYPYNIATP